MRRDLGPGDLGDLLEQPLLAVLATRLRDGSTLLSPVWHEWADGGFSVCIAEGDAKLAQVRRDPRVSLVVAENALPYRGIEVRGLARITSEPYAATMRRLALRHFGPGADALYPDTTAGVVVRIVAARTRCWDFADDVAALQGAEA
jgi:PPOX class probable F420-dependent enzyme